MAEGSLKVEPLTKHIGARVTGVDLRHELSGDVIEELRRAWLDHIVLVFPDQDLSQEDLLRVTGYFGQLGKLARPAEFRPSGFGKLLPDIMLISNIRENGQTIGALPDGEMMFHHDMIHAEMPHNATLLYSVEVPTHGGNTLFASGYAAYDTLDPAIRDRVQNRNARHHYHYGSTQRGDDRGVAANAGAAHPAFRTHDETGRKAIYINRLMTTGIEGIDQEEADRLLELIWDHSEKPEFVYEHVWSVGDLLVWDNRCSTHARTDFPSDQRRLMLRTTVQGTQKPY
ncbi:MAG: Taurine catabolism dioxygenase TauD/TfdA [Hyphomicrobiales bacterium]|nr:Taurine catabolism dioxygenase TauD/TfdA [Hyphomicrobiales bacterium]